MPAKAAFTKKQRSIFSSVFAAMPSPVVVLQPWRHNSWLSIVSFLKVAGTWGGRGGVPGPGCLFCGAGESWGRVSPVTPANICLRTQLLQWQIVAHPSEETFARTVAVSFKWTVSVSGRKGLALNTADSGDGRARRVKELPIRTCCVLPRPGTGQEAAAHAWACSASSSQSKSCMVLNNDIRVQALEPFDLDQTPGLRQWSSCPCKNSLGQHCF